jgi:hypothetical protein
METTLRLHKNINLLVLYEKINNHVSICIA